MYILQNTKLYKALFTTTTILKRYKQNTMTTIKNLHFKNNSTIEKVAIKYLNENKDKETIIIEMKNEFGSITNEVLRKKINDYLWQINKKLARVGQTTPSESISNNQTQSSQCLFLDIKEKKGKLFVLIKSNEAYENYLKSKKELKTTSNLWGKSLIGKFYHGSLIARPEFDDINRDIILLNQINYACLRLEGISQGLEIPIKNLVTIERLTQMLEKLADDYIAFYNKNILRNKPSVQIIVEEKSNDNKTN